MSTDYVFACSSCREEFLPSPAILQCEFCDAPLDVKYIQPHIATSNKGTLEAPSPLKARSDQFSLGEGNTPIITLTNLSNLLGIKLLTKNEAQNPTGSFKDRGMTVAVTMAVLEGSRDAAKHAVMLDPLTSATLSLDEIDSMFDEMWAAHGDQLAIYS